MHKIVFLGVLLFGGSLCGLQAQVHSEPFSAAVLGINVRSNVNKNLFHEYWNPSPGIGGSIGFPFYLGMAELNMEYSYFEGNSSDLPDIDKLLVSLGWVNRLRIVPKLRIGGGLRLLGSVLFFQNVLESVRIRVRDRFGSSSPETEIGVGLQADLTYELSPSWGIRAELNRNVIFTNTKLKLTYVGIGVVKTLKLPGWMREVLR